MVIVNALMTMKSFAPIVILEYRIHIWGFQNRGIVLICNKISGGKTPIWKYIHAICTNVMDRMKDFLNLIRLSVSVVIILQKTSVNSIIFFIELFVSISTLSWPALYLLHLQLLSMILPEIQVPLKYRGFRLLDNTSIKWILRPLIRGPGSGGVIITTDSATRPITDNITKMAIPMPFQLRWLGTAATNSCNE